MARAPRPDPDLAVRMAPPAARRTVLAAGLACPDYGRLTTPTFLIGGWMDEYVMAALRMLERCTNAPRRALIGNWGHDTPEEAYPGPNVDWMHEMVRFFDHWLKGVDNGVMDEPALLAFRHEWGEPEP